MMPELATRSALENTRSIRSDWNQFWFMPTDATILNWMRFGICSVTAIWFLTFLPAAGQWFGSDGILPPAMAGKLIEFEETARWQHWSPLWWTDSLLVIQVYLGCGIVLAILSAMGMGGRLSLALLLMVSIGWVHRITWLQGAIEPALVPLLGYLIVSPGTSRWLPSRRIAGRSWLHCLALRLIQVHWWAIVAVGVLSQLANIVWWRGEAMWWLAASGRSHILSIEQLASSASWVNLLTHGMILVQLVTLGLLLVPSTRIWGIAGGLLTAICLGLLADQTLYALLLATSAFSFWPVRLVCGVDRSVNAAT